MKTGAVLPAVCTVGEMFFKTDAPSGQNLFGCTANNVWSLQGEQAKTWNDFAVTASGQQLTVGSGCSLTQPCRVRFSNTVYAISNPATATITAGSGSGAAKLYVSSAGALTLSVPSSAGLTITADGLSVESASAPSVPSTGLPLADIAISSGSWGAVTDQRTLFSTVPLISGSGVTVSQAAGVSKIDVDPAVVPLLNGVNNYTGQLLATTASKTAPIRIGPVDPASCDATVRESFFNTTTNVLKFCTAANTWSAVQGAAAGSSPTDFAVSISGQNLTVSAGTILIGNTPYTIQAATYTLGDATTNGTVYVYVSPQSLNTLDSPTAAGMTINSTSGQARQVASPGWPTEGVYPIATVSVLAGSPGTWGVVTDRRSNQQIDAIMAGTGISDSVSGGIHTVGIDEAVVPQLGGNNIWTGDNDASAATKTAPFRLGPADPPTCDSTVREAFFNTTSNTLTFCTAANTWTAISAGSDSKPVMYTNSGANYGVNAGSTMYFGPGSQSSNASAIARQWIMAKSGTYSHLYVQTVTSQNASGNVICALRVNGVDSALTVTIPAGSGTTIVSDTTHNASVSAGDTVVLACTNSATTASANIGGWSLLFQ